MTSSSTTQRTATRRSLPVLASGTLVEVRGLQQNGTTTLTQVHVEDNDGGDRSGGSAGAGRGHRGSGGGEVDGGHR